MKTDKEGTHTSLGTAEQCSWTTKQTVVIGQSYINKVGKQEKNKVEILKSYIPFYYAKENVLQI